MKKLSVFFFTIFTIMSVDIMLGFAEILLFGPLGASKLDSCLFTLIAVAVVYVLYQTTNDLCHKNKKEEQLSDIVLANIYADLDKKEPKCGCPRK